MGGRYGTPAVPELLLHLERVGFAGAPRVLGMDGGERERVTYLGGDVAMRPWPASLRKDAGIGAWMFRKGLFFCFEKVF